MTYTKALLLLIIGFALIFVSAYLMARHYSERLNNTPCEEFKNYNQEHIPARCIKYFSK